jgi:hypothetical protein
MKLRFSLRALLAAMAIAALVCLWRDQPRRMAERFAAALKAGQYEEANAMVSQASDPTPIPVLDFSEFASSDSRNWITAERQPQTTRDWLAGRCVVTVRCEDFRRLGATIELTYVATDDGIQQGTWDSAPGIRYAPDPIMRQQLEVR